MALPNSGQLSLSAIAGELSVSLSNVSLRSMSNTAGFSIPDSISEFYGYSAMGEGELIEYLLRFNIRNPSNACFATALNTYYLDNSLPYATIIYTDIDGTTPALAGFYSDGFQARQWNGSQFIGSSTFC
jgi:hypothetical protein